MLAIAPLIVSTTRSTKPRKSAERPVVVGKVPFEREIGAVELQQKPVRDDRLVFDPERGGERGEIGFLGVVIFVLHRGGDDAGRRRGHERLDKPAGPLVERGAEIGAFGLQLAVIDIAHLADRSGGS